MMWFLLLLLHTLAHFGPASSSDPKHGKIILRSKDSPCKGHVEAYYDNVKGYVGDKYWNKATEEVVCRSTHCGKPENGTKDVYRPLDSKVWLNELQCQGNENSLWYCGGWPGPEVSFYKKPTVKMITCSNKIKINLKQHKCEGAVQYTVQSTGQPNITGYICSKGFGNEEADILCESLGCGGVTEILRSEWMHLEDKNVEMKEMDCLGIANVNHPWQCVKSASPLCGLPVLIRCEGHHRVQLKGNVSNVCSGRPEKEKNGNWKSIGKNKTISKTLCQQMHCGASGYLTEDDKGHHLTCSDRVSVVLTDDRNSETKCYGRVRIKVNNSIETVCGTDWTSENAEMVCKELNCGKVISSNSLGQRTNGILDHVNCTGSESSLWHCRAKHHNNIGCSSVPHVVCSGSVKVKLEDGPGRCAGRLEVEHKAQWKTALSEKWDTTLSAVVCKQLKCGNSGTRSSKAFAKGTNNFLTLSCSPGTQISDISECIKDNQGTRDRSDNQVEITCENHKVVFLEESKPCSGTVGIEYRDKIHWLSGSNQTWNQNVANMICQQLHCGNVSNFLSKPSKNQTSQLVESRNCSSSHKSLLECNIPERQESDYNQTLAYVECEGNIKVTLTNGCWGKVNISTASKQGYVSEDAWKEDMSVQLCKELACQDKTLPTHNRLEETIITFKSLHALRTDRKLSQHSLVDANTELRQKPAYVVCKGSIKPRFKPSRDKCSGNIEVFFEGNWIPVHKDALENTDNQNTICEELNCGKAVKTIAYFGLPEGNHLIRRLQCQKNTNSLATCQDVVVEKIEGTPQTSKLTGLKCSKWSTVALEVEHSCKGEVVVYSEGVNNQEPKRSFVSSQGWTAAEGERLCMDLKCGEYILINNRTVSAQANSLWSQSFNCSSKSESIWQCEKNQIAISQENKLFLECKDEPKVVLSNKCTGKLTINGIPVCSSQWTLDYSHRVCQQLNCGNAIFYQSSSPSSNSYHVHCDEPNYLIGQCKRVGGKCNKGLVSISCVDSVSFKTSEKCGGVLTIKYGKDTQEVCEPNISTELSNKLCQSLQCGPFERKGPSNRQTPKNQTSLTCPNYYKDPRYCLKNEPCSSRSTFTCTGYQPPASTQEPPGPTNPVPYIVGVLILLMLVVLIVIFVRYRINRRNRKSMVPSDMEEADWDSGEYEDVDKSDEMESFDRRRFRSESEVQGENDVDSNRSYKYDDIDEVTEAQPLTPQGSMVRATEDEGMREGDVEPSDEGVTYEVEDTQENYDDIDASPENTETTAEVHDGPKPAPEGDAAAPKDKV